MRLRWKRYRYLFHLRDNHVHGEESEVWDFEEIKPEYLPSDADDDLTRELKEAIFTELTEVEQRLLIAYAECGTYAGVARLFHSTPPTVRKRLREIIEKIT